MFAAHVVKSYTNTVKRGTLIICSIIFVVLLATILVIHRGKDPRAAKTPRVALVSMGDSVAAGDGLPEAPGNLASLCHQSVEAYPYLVASNLNLQLHQFACSGAQVSDGILQAQTVGSQSVTPQFEAAKPYLPHSNVIITIGANDVNWDSFLISCAQSNCQTPANLALFQSRLTSLQSNLNILLSDIAAQHPHTVLLNTYYSIIANNDTCLQQFRVTNASIAWVNAREADLNAAIVATAEAHHDRYATVTFSGHGLCDPDPWVQGLSGAAPLHPTYEGQDNIATLDEAALRP
jgi:lysophospholipase L1-like esterase